MKVLVTGATGFLGRHVVAEALSRGMSVVACGRKIESVQDRFPGARWVHVDGTKAESWKDLDPLVSGLQSVVHCAARSSPWGLEADFYRDNVFQTQLLVEWLKGHPEAFLVHVSTPSVYSNVDLPTDQAYEHREEDPLPRRFINSYAATKAEAERFLLYSKIPHVVFRPRAIVGPGDPSIMPRLIRLAKRGFLPRFSETDPRTDLTHVTDVAKVLVDAAESRARAKQRVYNVSSGDPVRLYTFLKKFFQGLGLPIRFVSIPQTWVRKGIRAIEKPWSRLLPDLEMPMTEMAIDLFTRDQWLNIDALRRDFSFVPRFSGESLFHQLLTDYQDAVASLPKRF